uniref:Uncharacterized protein n=1 Tax=Opuntia streptacantha TaxID=393608 RepID=A0A7C8ZFM0_OPUST
MPNPALWFAPAKQHASTFQIHQKKICTGLHNKKIALQAVIPLPINRQTPLSSPTITKHNKRIASRTIIPQQITQQQKSQLLNLLSTWCPRKNHLISIKS